MARSFNGANTDLIKADAAGAFTQTANYAVALWVNAPGSTSARVMYCEGRSTTANPFLVFQTGPSVTGVASVVCRNDAGGTSQINTVATTSKPFDSTWHHWVYTQSVSGSTTTWAVYVDGVADSTCHGSFTNGATTINELTIGALRRNTTTSPFTGTLADVAVFHRSLSAKEAVSLASGLPASHLGPTHYWPLWGVDSPEPDIGTGPRTNGTLTGTAFASGGRVSGDLLTLAG